MLQQGESQLPSNLVVFHDGTHADKSIYHNSIDNLTSSLLSAGSGVIDLQGSNEFVVPNDANVVLLQPNVIEYTDTEMSQITNWFNSDGSKLLWMGGEADFDSTFRIDNSHALLERLGSRLRFVSSEILDNVSNDGANYRILCTGFPTNGSINQYTSQNVDSILTHGATGVVVYENQEFIDPIRAKVSNIEILATTSNTSYGVDQDGSNTEFDLYNQSPGPFPMVVIERISKGKWIITSGESIFSDYKDMYGNMTQQGVPHDGSTFVDNILLWFSIYGADADLNPSQGDLSIERPDNGTFLTIGIIVVLLPLVGFLANGAASSKTDSVSDRVKTIISEIFAEKAENYLLFGTAISRNDTIEDTISIENIPKEFLNEKDLFNPIRLAMCKILSQQITLTLSEVREKLDIGWSEFHNNARALSQKGYITLDDAFREGKIVKVISITTIGLEKFNQVKNFLTEFLK